MGTSYRLRIGLREVQAMEPNTTLWDQEVRGFVARKQHSNIVTFSVVYRTKNGLQRWQKLARYPIFTPQLARLEAIKVLRSVALGEDPSGERIALRNSLTIEELCDEYSERDNGKKAATVRSDNSRIKLHIKPKLGKLKVIAVTTEQVDDFARSLSNGSAARCIGLLGAMFTYAVKRKLVTVNPVHGVEKPKDVKRTRRLSEAEYIQLGASLNGNVSSDTFLLLAVTGFRSGEAKNLRWEELDMERRIATLGDTKTGVSVRPLSDVAIEIIKRQPKNDIYVFGKQGNIQYPWQKLGLSKDITPHTLRHSFASLAADLGYADSTIAGLIGHKQQSMTSRYLHLDKTLNSAADKVANETLRLMRH
jgi:integrase